jgi:colanic acid biosynthesis protein WcaM
VAIYGCDNFIIDNVDMVNSAGMLIGYGVIKGDYLSIPQNFKLNNIHLDNRQLAYKLRGIQISSGNATSFVAITNVEMQRATLELHNKPQHLFLQYQCDAGSRRGSCPEDQLRSAQGCAG